tara:strand:- start:1148 stop:1933 length:786 start_codon:yes stop_codon:yes gene_type:complete
MIVANIKGGLCNQLFQIAAGYALARRCDTFFGINYDMQHNCIQGHHPKRYKDSLYKNIHSIDEVPTEIYREPKFEYSPIPEHKDLLIDGYFQSEKYFDDCKDEIKGLFTFPEEVVTKVDNKLSQIDKKIIGVHVRRGDYKVYSTTHPLQTTEYYDRALRHFSLERTAGNCMFVLCTDDLPSVQTEFDLDEYGFIYSNAKSELEDLYLLSQCDSVIISNSSFAWWGAWLGKEKEKVICPGIWFGHDGPQDYHDIFVHSWEKE